MNNKWNRNNALWMLLYAVLYAIVTAVVCVTGSIHPIFFVCYQITAGLLLSPIIIRALRRVQAPGVAVCKSAGSGGGRLPVSGNTSSAAYHKRCGHVACCSADRHYGFGRNCKGNGKIQLGRRYCVCGADELFQLRLLWTDLV